VVSGTQSPVSGSRYPDCSEEAEVEEGGGRGKDPAGREFTARFWILHLTITIQLTITIIKITWSNNNTNE
jgi:hypothetical protein